MTDIKLFTPLPAPSEAPPAIQPNTVVLYRDDNWRSESLTLRINEYVPGQRQRVPNFMDDQATFIAFNLPVGTVMTLMDNVVPTGPGGRVADLSGCGPCVDLIGTGATHAVDLRSVNMNDCISMFFWRQINLDMGAIEVFNDVNFAGNRSTIFLSEWDPDAIYSIANWWLQDRISAVRWRSLTDRQTGALCDNADGSGDQYNNIKGWGDVKEVANLIDYGFNDRASSFIWHGVNPVKEIIAPFAVTANTGAGSFGLTSVMTGTNRSSLAQPVTITLNNSDAQTVTVSTTDQHVVSVSSTLSLTATEGVKDVESASATWSITLSYSYTHSDTHSTSETKTVALTISEAVNAPPNSAYKATLLVTIGKIPTTVYHTTAERWYVEPITGGQPDPLNNNWYKRVEPVAVTVEGSLAADTTTDMEATPLT